MDELDSLRLVYETHIDASLVYDERRFTLLQSYLVGVTVVFAFWFNTADPRRQSTLFAPLISFTAVATFFAAYLVYVYSRDSHVYFLFAEEMMYRLHEVEVGARSAPADRSFFTDKWSEAGEKFRDRKRPGVLLLWVIPICLYALALMLAAFFVKKDAQNREHGG